MALLLLAGCLARAPPAAAPEQHAPIEPPCTPGVIVDDSVRPVANANVTLVETGQWEVTDAQGAYCLRLPAAGYTLDVRTPDRHWRESCDPDGRCVIERAP